MQYRYATTKTGVSAYQGRKKVFSDDQLEADQREAWVKMLEASDQDFESLDDMLEYANDAVQDLLDEDDGEDERGSIVPARYKERYGKEQNCGDEMASVLSDYVNHEEQVATDDKGGTKTVKCVSITACQEVAEANDLIDRFTAWANLNPGQIRMNLGNVLRGRIKRGEAVTVGEREWPENLELQAELAEAKKAKRKEALERLKARKKAA